MKVRWLGHSCIEILGQRHILIDPDYQREPMPNLDYILITHGHEDHLGKVAQLCTGSVLASPDVCEIASQQGVPARRLQPVEAGTVVDNIRVLKGHIPGGSFSGMWARLFGRSRAFPGGTPLSFLVEDDWTLLHMGDGYRAPCDVYPDILCLAYRAVPLGNERYKRMLVALANRLNPKAVIPIHHDLPGWEANPEELRGKIDGELVISREWVELR